VVFSSPVFLFAFLPLVLLGLALVRVRIVQAIWLLGASIAFYVWGAGAAVLLLFGVTLVGFVAGLLPWHRIRARRARGRLLLGVVIAVLLLPIVFFKYVPTLVAQAGGGAIAAFVIPLGISFFTFHAISYVVDVYRETIEPERRPHVFALYLFLFPHQIAGPIVRYAEIRAELGGFRDPALPQFGFGFIRFTWGLTKKVMVADPVGRVADVIFAANAGGSELSIASAWLGAVLYAVQIYFDFSGYSDMAIGLALMLGFHFPENFNQPYRAISVTDFWRRWHMTLTRWFRDYVYFPLGGNRRGPLREYGALLLVFALTSLWHGATWGFLIWGALHSAALIIERVTGIRESARFAVLRRVLVLVFIVLSWVPFRAGSLDAVLRYWGSMLHGPVAGLSPGELTQLSPVVAVALLIAVVSAIGRRDATGFGMVFGTRSVAELEHFRWRLAVPTTVILFAVSVIVLLWADFSPFLYFQF
jgi:alginate O-acetyltransferase complex protein AlgI